MRDGFWATSARCGRQIVACINSLKISSRSQRTSLIRGINVSIRAASKTARGCQLPTCGGETLTCARTSRQAEHPVTIVNNSTL